jgi:hypothetical protein
MTNNRVCHLQPTTVQIAGVALALLALCGLGVGLGVGLTRNKDKGAPLNFLR